MVKKIAHWYTIETRSQYVEALLRTCRHEEARKYVDLFVNTLRIFFEGVYEILKSLAFQSALVFWRSAVTLEFIQFKSDIEDPLWIRLT